MIWDKDKIIKPENLKSFAEQIKGNGKTLATLNGSFDLMHAGHLQIIFEASKTADILLVALNSDESIKKYKSPKRPIISLKFRMEMMAAIEFVDYVTWFEETDPRDFLQTVKPNVHVNGSEYGENCIEAEVVKSNGGKIHIVNKIPSLSTTQVIQKILNSCD